MRIKNTLALLLVATIWGCADAPTEPAFMEQQQDDHELLVVEGSEVYDQLNAALESPVFTADEAFARLGLLWDAPAQDTLELRTSPDGIEWTDWQLPIVTFEEEGIFTGHIDVAEGGQRFQYRLLDAEALPTWVQVVPIAEIPTANDDEPPPPATEDEETPESSSEASSASSVPINSRASWGARAPRCVSSTVPNRVTIHHTVTPTNDSMSPKARLRQIQAFHMYTMGWCDIGYNYLISRDGRVWKGRGRNRLGAHVANNNSGNVGISFMGNYSSTKVNRSQRCGAASLLRWLHTKAPAIKLVRSDIKGHRQYGATACPGNALYGQLNAIVALAHDGGCN